MNQQSSKTGTEEEDVGGGERAAYKEGKRKKKNMEHEETEGKQEGRELEMVKAEKYGMALWT